jgi:membrane-bound serine protease (ClpP class)
MELGGWTTVAFGLIVLSFLLLAAEMLFPSGILAVLAMVTLVIGVTVSFSQNATTGLITLGTVVILLPVAGGLLVRIWPQTWIGRRLFLSPEPEATVAQSAGNQELEKLIGRYGKALCDLRPSGVADFEGRRIDVITEGMLVDRGRWVRCIDVRSGHVVVRPTEPPDLGRLESAEI